MYQVLRSENLLDLEDAVNDKLHSGDWHLVGGICVIKYRGIGDINDRFMYLQAVQLMSVSYERVCKPTV